VDEHAQFAQAAVAFRLVMNAQAIASLPASIDCGDGAAR
jgi:hypothetical protein